MRRRFIIAALVCLVAATARAETPEISGFVDASHFVDLADGGGEFGLDQAEVDVIHRASDKTLVRADLEWVKDGEAFDAAVEQAFMQYDPCELWTITFGRFNAPIGFELLDPNEMYQYSHALVFDHGLPSNLTGLMVDRDLGASFDLRAYAVNGWDVNAENNKLKTWGGRLGWSDGDAGAGLSAIGGRDVDPSGGSFDRTVIDADLSYMPDGWVFGGEINHGSVDPLAGDTADWFGLLAMAHRDFDARWGLTMRWGLFDDRDGWTFGLVDDRPQKRQAFTIAPTLVLDEGFGALLEVRVDKSDRYAFTDRDGKPTDTKTTVAFEATYSF